MESRNKGKFSLFFFIIKDLILMDKKDFKCGKMVRLIKI